MQKHASIASKDSDRKDVTATDQTNFSHSYMFMWLPLSTVHIHMKIVHSFTVNLVYWAEQDLTESWHVRTLVT